MAFTIPSELQLNLGSYPNDGTGDDLYTAFTKVKGSIDLIGENIDDITGGNLGAGTAIFVDRTNSTLRFKTLTSTKLAITSTATTVNIEGLGRLSDDLNPQLGGSLSLNNKSITGTGGINITGTIAASNVTSLVYGIDIRQLQNQVNAGGGGENVDFGSFTAPAEGDTDFGNFI